MLRWGWVHGERAGHHADALASRLAPPGGPGIILDDQICLHVVAMGVAWTVEVTGYPHLPGTQGRWEQHPAVTSAKVTPPRACKHGRGRG